MFGQNLAESYILSATLIVACEDRACELDVLHQAINFQGSFRVWMREVSGRFRDHIATKRRQRQNRVSTVQRVKNQSRLRTGIVGPGFIAAHHIDAVRRLGNVDVIGIAGSSLVSAERKAQEWNIERAYASYEELIEDPEIDVIHNTTPSATHYSVSLAALRAGKHVISDKPLALTPQECAELCVAAEASGTANAVTFNYRGNPLVQEARSMVESGKLGTLSFVHGQYLQDWMTDPNVYSWRMDPKLGGPSSALADIGSHWCDLAEHISGARITEVLCDFTTVVKTRYSSGGSKEAFSKGRAEDSVPVTITGEDLAVVLLRFDSGVLGTLKVGQVLPGHKNDMRIELNGSEASLGWNQEEQNELWIGRSDRPNELLMKDPSLIGSQASAYAKLPGGHQEGWPDAFRNVIADAYSWVRVGGSRPPAGTNVCTFLGGYRISCVIQAMLESKHRGGVWTPVLDETPAEYLKARAV